MMWSLSAGAKLKTVVIEKAKSEGSISNSELVEDFPCFPQGISWANLSANMISQAMSLGLCFEFIGIASARLVDELRIVNASPSQVIKSLRDSIERPVTSRCLGHPGQDFGTSGI